MGVREYKFAGDNSHLLNEYHRQLDSLGEWQITFLPDTKHQTYAFARIASGTSVSGYMPRGYNCGFIYYGGSEHTVAHELGLGIVGLQHVFENSNNSGKTNNLMDYSTGDELWHFQWDQKVIYDLSLYKPIKSSNKVYIDIIITIQDWYGADEDDFIGNNSLYPQEKHNQLCLNAFFLLQHKFGCSPFITEVIFHDYLEFNFE